MKLRALICMTAFTAYGAVASLPASDTVSLKTSSLAKDSKSKLGSVEKELLTLYKRKYSSKVGLNMLKKNTLDKAQRAVPALIKVMKSSQYPDKNRWVATFMLGRIMGKKSSSFISKFAFHPNWMLRLASLKTLLALDQKQYKGIYTKALKDDAMIVRMQALDNIKAMNLKELAPYVWAMLYDKSNYAGQKGNRKRAHIVKQVISLVGDLKFEKARAPMLKMIQDNKYKDIFEELDYSLNKITGKESPSGGVKLKKRYWTRLASSAKIIK
ncbi:MAG: HEAT repeat domain-containing protein [Bacteriovoracaceae bacterium]|nr:HEAT repeat domain-containing protein [Bacteriovoracaceae bacterium]